MTLNYPTLLAALLFAMLPLATSGADEQAATTESRLRDALKTTMLQLRDAQNQVVTLQAAQVESDKATADLKAKVDALTGQVTTLTQQAASDKAASDKTIADLNTQVVDQTAQITKFNEAIAEWKKSYGQTTDLARTTEAARAKLAGDVIVLQRLVADRELKNLELFKTGNEILTRYEKFGLGDAIGAKEPFVGITRVKLEELVQDYQDKLLDQKVIPGQAPAPSAQSTTLVKPVKPSTSTAQASVR